MTGVLSLGGVRARSVRLVVPATGIWVADIRFEDVYKPASGLLPLTLGALTLQGTVDLTQSGDFALQSRITVIGGHGGWRTVLPPKPNHNDGGITKSRIINDVAASVGETVSLDPGVDGSINVDFPQAAGPASRVLEQLFPSFAWWIQPDGSTRVGTRPTKDVTSKVELIDLDPRLQFATLTADDATNLLPGCSFTDPRLSGAFVIHDVEIVAEGDKLRAFATASKNRDEELLSLFGQLQDRHTPNAAYQKGPYRYRVISMASDRVNCQIVNQKLIPALPDLLPIGMAASPGIKAQLQPGAIVLVDFIEGDPSMPWITGFSRPDDPGFLPVSVTLDASGTMAIGQSSSKVSVAGEEPSDPVTGAKRFIRVGDILVPPTSLSPTVPYVVALGPTNPTMSKAGT